MNLIYRETAISARRMPIAIRRIGYGRIGLGIIPHMLSASLNKRAAMLSPQMKEELLRVSLIGCVTTHTLPLNGSILNYRLFVEVVNIALIVSD